MAGTGKKGYTGTLSDGRTISNGIVQGGGSSSSSRSSSKSSGGSSNYGARVSAETHENGQPKYVYTSSGKAVPTYGYRVVQGGSDGKLYDINNGRVSPINGGSGSPTQVIGGSGGGAAGAAYNAGSAVASALSGRSSGDGGGSSGRSGGRYGSGGGYGGYGYDVVDPEVQALKDRLTALEGNKPGAYTNQYEGQIEKILDTILNRQPFDITKDANYGMLYNLYGQHFAQNASRAARDAMGQLAGMTGGYGNTYAQTAGSQAYDNIMQGLNDSDIALANLAYGMYQDDRNFDLNKMNTLRGLENSDYGKYRDLMSDYYNDLNHYTNRYNTAWGNQYQLNRDSINDARYEDERDYQREQDRLNRELAAEALEYERSWNEDERNWDRGNTTAQQALSLLKAGYNPNGYLDSSGYGDSAGWLRDLYNQTQVSMAPEYSTGSRPGSSNKNPGRYDNSSSLTWQDVEAMRQDKGTSAKTTSAAYSLLSDAEKTKYLQNHKPR